MWPPGRSVPQPSVRYLERPGRQITGCFASIGREVPWRLVNDLEPGSATVASTGMVVNGADQSSPGTGVIVANRTSFQCVQRYIQHLLRYLVIAFGVVDEPAIRGI